MNSDTSTGGLRVSMVFLSTTSSSLVVNRMAVTRVPCVERANKGQFMLTEATEVAANGHGYPNTPGIYTEEQMDAWKPVVSAVKDKGAIFFCQIWHCGRASHSVYNEGAPPAVLFHQPCSPTIHGQPSGAMYTH